MKDLGSLKIKKPCDWLTQALNGNKSNVTALKALEKNIVGRLKVYDSLILNYSEKLDESLFLKEKELLIEYYESAPSALKRLIRDRRDNHGLLACPFCGRPSIPDTLDHFIPKDNWPEFSINPNNLVPQCRGCAPAKGVRYYCEQSNEAMYVHPVYASWLSEFRFKIKTIFSRDSKEVEYKIIVTYPKDTNPSYVARVTRHLENLNFKHRSYLYCSREVSNLKSLLLKKKFDIHIYLRVNLDSISEQEMRRDWRSALYESILENEDLMGYLKTIEPKSSTALSVNEENEIEF